jgi:hypothetical protein
VLAGVALVLVTVGATAPAASVAATGGRIKAPSPPTWRLLSSHVVPPAREYGSMAYDPAAHEIVLFGGLGNNLNPLGDTWVWKGAGWSNVTTAHGPPARLGASMAYDAASGRLVLFGGVETIRGLGGGGELNDTWTWNGTSWTELHPASSPAARAYASMAYDAATSQLVLYGGEDPNTRTFFGDTWTWNGAKWKDASVSTNVLGARDTAAMAYDPARRDVVLFGGSTSLGTDLADTWTWNGTKWVQAEPAHSPSVRDSASMDYDQATGQLVLFGGYHAGNLNDTWTWSGTTWIKLTPSKSPPARSGATMAYDVSTAQLLVFSGYPSLDDTWSWGLIYKAPGAPTSLKATSGKLEVTLSWKAPTPAVGSVVTGYDVYKGTSSHHESGNPVNASPLSHHALTFVVTSLKKGHRYYFIVKAINVVAVGAASNQASAVPS